MGVARSSLVPSATSLSWLDLKSSMVDVTVVIPTIPQRRSFLKDATDSVDYQTVQPSEVMRARQARLKKGSEYLLVT